MSATVHPGSPRRLGVAAMLAIWAAVLVRTLALSPAGDWPWYAAGFGVFLAVLLIALFRPIPAPLLHVGTAVQAAIVLLLLGIDPEHDFVTVLFVLQCYQTAVVFPALPRTVWVVALVCLTGASLVLELGPVRGLALGLIPMAAGVVLSTYVAANRELDAQQAAAERLVAELQAAQRRLLDYAGQADELAALEQRALVAAELDESVAATLAEVQEAGAEARVALDRPALARPRLERLQELTKQALAQMRRVIGELRPGQP